MSLSGSLALSGRNSHLNGEKHFLIWQIYLITTQRSLWYVLEIFPIHILNTFQAMGTAVPSFTTTLLESTANVKPEDEHAIKWAAASLYGGNF